MKSMLDEILQADNLPSLPAVSIQVLRLIQSEDVSVNEIARVIEQDPALAAKILKVVNSPLFGLPKKIASLPQAMIVLGLRTVKVMALSFSLINDLRKEMRNGFDYEKFWKRSITTAVCCRLLSNEFDPAVTDEAFIAGLLADLGILAASHYASEDYMPIVVKYEDTGVAPQEVEGPLLGMTHANITAALLNHWGLPGEVAEAIERHHDPVAPAVGSDGNKLSRVLWSAALVSDLFCGHTSSTLLNDTIEDIARQMAERTSPEDIMEAQGWVRSILQQVDEHVHLTAAQIAIDIGTVTTFNELQQAAMAELAQLSMKAELDRAAASRQVHEAKRQLESLSNETRALAREVLTDSLTDIANRKSFNQKIAQLVEQRNRTGSSMGLIMLDVDRFKRINDTYGHLFGDEVLKVMGQTLKKLENDNRHVARYGGEEFAILCAETTLDELTALAEMILQETARIEVHYGTKRVKFTTSAGAAQVAPSSEPVSAEGVIEQADQCLRQAKQAGRNQSRSRQI